MNCFHNMKRISSHIKVVLLLLGIVVSLYFGVYTTVMTNNDHLYTAYGGVYLDIDEILLRPLEPLRKYEHTQGYEEAETLLGNQLIMSKKNATFLNLWYDTYRHYQPDWTLNSLQLPVVLSKMFPCLIHVDGFNFTHPNYQNTQQIFKGNYDWSTNYGMHLFIRDYKNDTNVEIIRTLNTTIGAVCRHILFGNKELCSN